MYEYRNSSIEKQKAILLDRQSHAYPQHSPPHIEAPDNFRLITGTCFEHKHILNTPERRGWFEGQLIDHIQRQSLTCAAWVILPNHYHILLKIPDINTFSLAQGQLHGRTSIELNRKDNAQGRQCWCRYSDRSMRSDRHYFTTINYIHNNPVKHGYVKKWGDWPFSSFQWYLENKGREWLVDMWFEYPLRNYGDQWDA